MNNGVPDGWEFRNVNSANDFNAAIASVKAGDPVVVYTRAGGWYPSSKHIYVLVGWDDASKQFIVNNPFPKGVQIHIKGTDVDKPKQTLEHLFKYNGQSTYSHGALIIRSAYK
jgi:hypothetical protein